MRWAQIEFRMGQGSVRDGAIAAGPHPHRHVAAGSRAGSDGEGRVSGVLRPLPAGSIGSALLADLRGTPPAPVRRER
jgi:hypothetical protein